MTTFTEYIRFCRACPWFQLDSERTFQCEHHEMPRRIRVLDQYSPPPKECPIRLRDGITLVVVDVRKKGV